MIQNSNEKKKGKNFALGSFHLQLLQEWDTHFKLWNQSRLLQAIIEHTELTFLEDIFTRYAPSHLKKFTEKGIYLYVGLTGISIKNKEVRIPATELMMFIFNVVSKLPKRYKCVYAETEDILKELLLTFWYGREVLNSNLPEDKKKAFLEKLDLESRDIAKKVSFIYAKQYNAQAKSIVYEMYEDLIKIEDSNQQTELTRKINLLYQFIDMLGDSLLEAIAETGYGPEDFYLYVASKCYENALKKGIDKFNNEVNELNSYLYENRISLATHYLKCIKKMKMEIPDDLKKLCSKHFPEISDYNRDEK